MENFNSNKIQKVSILILEDDLETLSIVLKKLHLLEEEFRDSHNPMDFSVVVLSEYTQVEDFINKPGNFNFDIVLLDRDCKAGGSFHVLDFDKIGAEKIISISSIPDYNEEAKSRGVSRVIWKDYQNLEKFAEQVIKAIVAVS